MGRKHMPGCYCCQCPTELTPPDITIDGFTGEGWTGFSSDCCASQYFQPDEPIFFSECSDVVDSFSQTLDCHTDYYQLIPVGPPPPEPKTCEEVINNCCAYCSNNAITKIGESDTQITNTFETKLWKYYELVTLKITYMRKTVLCNSVPTQKYILVLEYYYHWIAKWMPESVTSIVQTTNPTYECAEKASDLQLDGECTLEARADCTVVPPNFLGSIGCSQGLCNNSGGICFSRIKFFTDQPDGEITFTSSDVPGACEVPEDWPNIACPVCDNDPFIYDGVDPTEEPNWASQVCIDMDVLCEPLWCTYPPVIVENEITYEFNNDCACQVANLADCCDDPFYTVCTQNPIICSRPPLTKTVKCFTFECPAYDQEEAEGCPCAWGNPCPTSGNCGIFWPGVSGSVPEGAICNLEHGSLCCCHTQNGLNSTCTFPPIFPFVPKFDCINNSICGGEPPCVSSNCCYQKCVPADCTFPPIAQPCLRCFDLYYGSFHPTMRDSTASVSVSCNKGTPDDFCFSPQNITIDIQSL